MIEAQKIIVRHGNRQILNKASCQIGAGITCVLGPNGAGKSTLLKTLCGALPPDEGKVNLDGENLYTINEGTLAQRRAVLGQNVDVAFPFSVLEIVLMGRTPHSATARVKLDKAVAMKALETMDAASLAGRSFPSLSGGEKQRIQLARVLVQISFLDRNLTGRYLFLDEPIAALDLRHQQRLKATLHALKDKGLSIFCILHDINYACDIADNLLLIKKGILHARTPQCPQQDLENLYDVEMKPSRGGREGQIYYMI
jgi:iron complex transport system ATP-binding protein